MMMFLLVNQDGNGHIKNNFNYKNMKIYTIVGILIVCFLVYEGYTFYMQERWVEMTGQYDMKFNKVTVAHCNKYFDKDYVFIKSNFQMYKFLKEYGCEKGDFVNFMTKNVLVTNQGEIKNINAYAVGYTVEVDDTIGKKIDMVSFDRKDYSRTRIEARGVNFKYVK